MFVEYFVSNSVPTSRLPFHTRKARPPSAGDDGRTRSPLPKFPRLKPTSQYRQATQSAYVQARCPGLEQIPPGVVQRGRRAFDAEDTRRSSPGTGSRLTGGGVAVAIKSLPHAHCAAYLVIPIMY